ncbi:vomeronasal type-1 receptor 1 [Ochotona curzoniae]|uniref:vomeronasal type-1 receptor 1 n=1 Tax=Ochotona curzoniae TaxID=130825 RepID=UPI001B3470B8|nr:vomeronasal type-1 receptor 1 [Ochotona curzoniae]
MFPSSLDMGIIFLTQTGIGLVGNSSLLCLYNFTLISGRYLRPTDLILNQLVLANSIVLFSKGIPQTMAAFGWKYFLDDVGCKIIFYFYRLATGVSFSTICLFNGFQAIKLDPSICKWMELKARSLRFIAFCCFICWVPHLLINSCLPVIVSGPLHKKNSSVEENYGYCSWHLSEDLLDSFYTLLYFSPDILSLGFLIWASGSTVLVLHRHKQRVWHIRQQRPSSRPSHEVRATHTILILVSFFVTFYSIYLTLTIWMTLVANQGQWMVNTSVLVASSFPAFSPFVLMLRDTRIALLCSGCGARRAALPDPPSGS